MTDAEFLRDVAIVLIGGFFLGMGIRRVLGHYWAWWD